MFKTKKNNKLNKIQGNKSLAVKINEQKGCIDKRITWLKTKIEIGGMTKRGDSKRGDKRDAKREKDKSTFHE